MIDVRRIIILVAALAVCSSLTAQQKKVRVPLKDSLDGSFDLSDYIIEVNGFIPVPIFITEPALGGFGAGLVPIFMKKRPPYIDSVKGKRVVTPIAPDVTGAAAIYTVNNTWVLAAFRQGTLVKSRIKYIVGGGYANVNISFYKTLAAEGEKEFKFNLKTVPVMTQAIKRLGYSHWYAGLKYLFLKTDAKYVGDPLVPPEYVSSKEYSTLVSQLGPIIELDNRDNTFTPDKGLKVHVDGMRSDNIFGSDFDFWHLHYFMFAYKPLSKKLIGGWRVDGQQSFGDQPFYLKPYVDMRGIPAARYQGNADLLTELELRWDFIKRWSLMFYTGGGKAFDNWSDFGKAEFVYSYGTGFRYLIARKFKLRMGLDIARGPEEFAYYIVFGSNWLK
jgi:hypothetical protein